MILSVIGATEIIFFRRKACSKSCSREIEETIVCRIDWEEAEVFNWEHWLENHGISLDKLKRFWQFELG